MSQPYDFAKLTTDVAAALQAGRDAAAAVSDGGSCNLDGVHLAIPRQRESKVVEALGAAGVWTSKVSWGWFGVGYMLNPSNEGQADKRYVACQAITKHLKEAGYDAAHYHYAD